jgi:hypothetical protein
MGPVAVLKQIPSKYKQQAKEFGTIINLYAGHLIDDNEEVWAWADHSCRKMITDGDLWNLGGLGMLRDKA